MISKKTTSPQCLKIAIIGGGITGSCAAHVIMNLAEKECQDKKTSVEVHLFDQGRRGVGGRSSDRTHHYHSNNETCSDINGTSMTTNTMRWDHGCQFFRADTDRFKSLVKELLTEDIVKEWTGDFRKSSQSSSSGTCKHDFFGMPSVPPFYVGSNGMQSVSKGVLDRLIRNQQDSDKDEHPSKLSLFTGTRVAQLERDEKSKKWKLWGTAGEAAFHDTSEKRVQQLSNETKVLGEPQGYDGIILTDVSSSFGKWHRASAGVPEPFACRVRERVGARVPLFTVMIAFQSKSQIPFDAASFDHPILWFASKTNSKPGMNGDTLMECWTLVSTSEYAMEKIQETPMQDTETGEFIPQTKDYLTTVPAPDLIDAFCKELMSKNGILGNEALSSVPTIIHMDAQRWGSAMPAHRHLDKDSQTRKVISGVPYDSGTSSLAPTKKVKCRPGADERNFLVDDELMLIQAGDMMSTFTPGFESAALSGMDAADYLLKNLSQKLE